MGVKLPSLSPIIRDLVEYRKEGKSPRVNIDIEERMILKGTLKIGYEVMYCCILLRIMSKAYPCE